jgi:hypothetical protein
MVDVIYPKLTLHFVDHPDPSIFKLLSVGGFTYMCRITYTVKVASRFISEANKSGGCTQLGKEGIGQSCSASQRKKTTTGASQIDQVQYSVIDKKFSRCLGKRSTSI